jgi:hypothetical protein
VGSDPLGASTDSLARAWLEKENAHRENGISVFHGDSWCIEIPVTFVGIDLILDIEYKLMVSE